MNISLERLIRKTRLVFLVILLALFAMSAVCQAVQKRRKTVLVLHSYHKGLSWTDSITEGIIQRFSEDDADVEFIYEFMDSKRYFSKSTLQIIEQFYLNKYNQQKFDVIISSDDNAFQFLLKNGDALFPGVPIVFCGVNNFFPENIKEKNNITGVQEDFDFAATIDVALTLQQGITKVVVIGDRTTSGLANRDKLMAVIPRFEGRVSFEILDNYTMEQVQAHVGGLQSDAIILWLHFTADKNGIFYSFEDSSEMISAASSVPLYSSWDFHMDHGIVGGMITCGHTQGYTAAGLALRILSGESPGIIPVISQSPNRYMFDYIQMERFGISSSDLPPDSVVINTPENLFVENMEIVLAIIGGFILLSAIILVLTISNIRRQRAEQIAISAKNRYYGIFNDTSVALLVEDFSGLFDQVENIRRKANGNFRAFFRENRGLLSSLARSIYIRDVNPAALKLYGAENKEQLGGSVHQLLKSGKMNDFVDFFTALLEEKETYVVEKTNTTLNGNEINIILEVKLPRRHQEFTSVLVSVVNITDMKRAERALLESEKRFRAAFNSAATRMALLGVDGRYQKVNKVLCRTLEYSASELQGMNWRDVTHPDDIDLTQRCIEKLLQGVSVEPLEKRYISKSGNTIWSLFSGSLIFDGEGKPVNIISQFQDITPRKEAEARLLEQKERYQKYFEDDLAGVFVVNFEGRFVTCNRAFRSTFGIEDLQQLDELDFFQLFPNRSEGHRFFNTMLLKKKLVHYDLVLHHLNGTKLDVVINAIGRFNRSGKLKEIQGYLMDVTQQKTLEAQLLQAQKLESIGTMAGGVAHDFNNLLMGVLGNTSLLLQGKDAEDPDYRRLRNIEEYVRSGSSLTRQLLGFAKGGKYEVKTWDIHEILSYNASLFSQTHKEVELELNLMEEQLFLDVDRSQIDQVMYNLYVNAWQAMSDGGKICIRTGTTDLEDAFVAPYGVEPGRYVRVEVEDNGAGIDRDILPRIFDPFFTTKEISRGIGLGLASSYGIIQNHSGIIEVKSDIGRGTCFTFYLPMSTAQTSEDIKIGNQMDVVTGKEKILFVDDEEMIIEVGVNMLELLGYSVEKAFSGQEALDKFKKMRGDVDLVILDMIMPGMSGGETFDSLRAIDNDVRVVLSSGYSLDQKAEAIMQRGCCGFLQKPFDLQTLSEKVRQVLESSM